MPQWNSLKKELFDLSSSECAATPELPRKPKLTITLEATPNVVVSLEMMRHEIRSQSMDILVMIDHVAKLSRLKVLHDRTALSVLNAFSSR